MATRIGPTTTNGAQRYMTQVPKRSAFADYDYSNFFYSASDDVFAIFDPYNEWWYGHARESGYYLFYQPMSTPPRPNCDACSV